MQKLKNTFRRSYSPAAAEIKSQDSLEVPKQIRSASFDDVEFRRKATVAASSSTGSATGNAASSGGDCFLRVPTVRSQRSKSFDSCGYQYNDKDPLNVTPENQLLDVPKSKPRRKSAGGSPDNKSSIGCIHCQLMDEYLRDCELEAEQYEGLGLGGFGDLHWSPSPPTRPTRLTCSSSESLETSSSEGEDDEIGTNEGIEVMPEGSSDMVMAIGGITIILSPNSPSSEMPPPFSFVHTHVERPVLDTGHSSSSEESDPGGGTGCLDSNSSIESDVDRQQVDGNTISAPPNPLLPVMVVSAEEGGPETVLSLDVPLMPSAKQVRSASVDSGFVKVPHLEAMAYADASSTSIYLEVPKAQRSRSVDIALPTDDLGSYRALQRSPRPIIKAIPPHTDVQFSTEIVDQQKGLPSVPDWSEHAVNGDHLWIPTSASGDFCYLADHNNCSRQGSRVRCTACKMIFHETCLNLVSPTDKKFQCKPTFHDVGIRQYRERTGIEHHWVHRKNQKGKCKSCSKSFQSKLSFSSKDVVAVICSWCKTAYHNKDPCFTKDCYKETCNLGSHANVVVPPSWIIKLPRKGSFKSSLRKPPKKRASSKRKSRKEEIQRTFVIKPIPSPNMKPLLVFINPRSGGNQGAKLMQKFQWLLNPRQVFDLSHGGPLIGLEYYKKVPNLRILACGGDGTVGWILSMLDEIGINPSPPVAVLPLGTGNDLARNLGWGGGYTDEPISKILSNIEDGEITQLDRFNITVVPNPYPDPTNGEEGKSQLPLNVVNNYFSLGADAYIALEFHEAREARPDKFNSRLRNKMFYGQAGGKDLLQRKWKDLSDYATLECDGKDLTPKLKELKVHAILFLNINSYGGGTHPWNNQSAGFESPTTHDGLIEVIGLTTYQLALLQAGGHGTCLAQCHSARVATTRTIPVQVDGEPCKLAPSLIELKIRNQVNMVAKAKKHGGFSGLSLTIEELTFNVFRISMEDYENYHYNKEKLHQVATRVCCIRVKQNADLEEVRQLINSQHENLAKTSEESVVTDWCFIDSITADRCFRIDRAQENLHYITDISAGDLLILDPELASSGGGYSSSSSINSPDAAEPPTKPSSEDSNNEGAAADKNSRLGMESGEMPPSKSYRPKTPVCRTPVLKLLSITSSFSEKLFDEAVQAAKYGDLELLKDLHNKGFNFICIDSKGMTVLHYAAQCGHKDIVRYIIANAPSSILDMKDFENSQTALHKAAHFKRRTICCMLVAAGALLNVVDKQGMTPKQHAQTEGDEDLEAYLQSQEQLQLVISKDLETTV
ncbi:hypothetical protein CHUAL_013138 [Chamberlinius hualienensis]